MLLETFRNEIHKKIKETYNKAGGKIKSAVGFLLPAFCIAVSEKKRIMSENDRNGCLVERAVCLSSIRYSCRLFIYRKWDSEMLSFT